MSIVNAKEIMVEAAKNGYAVGAFNVTDLLQFEAVIDAGRQSASFSRVPSENLDLFPHIAY